MPASKTNQSQDVASEELPESHVALPHQPGPSRKRGWLRSAAFHHWSRVALRQAFSKLCARLSCPALQCEMLSDVLPLFTDCGEPGGTKRPSSPPAPDVSCSLAKRPMHQALTDI